MDRKKMVEKRKKKAQKEYDKSKRDQVKRTLVCLFQQEKPAKGRECCKS
jgi:hypothetical protein